MVPRSPKTHRTRLLAVSCVLFALLTCGVILSINKHDKPTTTDAVIVTDKDATSSVTTTGEPTASVASLNDSSDQFKSATQTTQAPATAPDGIKSGVTSSGGAQTQARDQKPDERDAQSEKSKEREREASGALQALAQRALQMQDEFGDVPENALVRAFEQKREMAVDPRVWAGEGNNPMPLTAGVQPSSWVSAGPGNIGGRTRAIAIDPANPNTLYLGGASGGVWKTTNAGATWQALNDFMANLAITSIVIDPRATNTVYAATGEGFGNGPVRGAGIFKSTDAGATWAQLASTANTNFHFVNRLAIDPNNSQILLAVTARSSSTPTNQSGANGIWRSENGGTTWDQVNSAGQIYDVDFHPTDSQKALASGEGRILNSNDNGRTWTEATGISSSFKRIEISYARSQPQKVFASVSNVDKGSGQIFGSEDGGASFTRRDTQEYKFLGDQGDYDNALWVDPVDPSILIVGGIDLFRSTDGGATLTKISEWQQPANVSAHADHHVIVSHPQYDGTTNKTVYFGNDGGIYRANARDVQERAGWTLLNNQLGITQFYGAAGHAASGRIVGGTQDNGTIRYAGNTEAWSEVNGGDGGYAAYDPVDVNYYYGEYTNLTIARATTADGKMTDIYNGITDANNSARANFIAPFILDPNNSSRMLAGGRSLWRSNNVKAETPTWTSIKPPSATNQNISAIAVKPGNPDVIWVGHNDGKVFYTINGTSDAPTWTPVAGLPERYITRITLGNAGDNRIYVTTGGFTNDNIQRTTDNGATWTNVQSNMPQAPVRSLVIHPTNPEWLAHNGQRFPELDRVPPTLRHAVEANE